MAAMTGLRHRSAQLSVSPHSSRSAGASVRNSATSPPALNALPPAPRITTTRTASSRSRSMNSAGNSLRMATVIVFIFGWRSIHTVAIAPFRSTRRNSLIAPSPCISPRGAVGVEVSHVTGEVPAVTQRAGVGIGTVPVAGEGFRRIEAGDDLALLAGGDDCVGTDRGFRARRDDAQDGVEARPSRTPRLQVNVRSSRERIDLGRAGVIDEDLGSEGIDVRLGQGRQHGGAGLAEFADRRAVGARAPRGMAEAVEERRDQMER